MDIIGKGLLDLRLDLVHWRADMDRDLNFRSTSDILSRITRASLSRLLGHSKQ